MLVNIILPLEVKLKTKNIKLNRIKNKIPGLYHKNICDFFDNNVYSYEIEGVKYYEVEYKKDKEEFEIEKCYIDVLKLNDNKKFNDIILVNLELKVKEEQLSKLRYLSINRYPDYRLKTKLVDQNKKEKYLFSTEQHNEGNISNLLFKEKNKLKIINYPLGYYSYLIYDYESNSSLKRIEDALQGDTLFTKELSLLYEFSQTPFRKEYLQKINENNVLKKSDTNIFISSENSFGRVNTNDEKIVTDKYIYLVKLVLLQKVGMLMFQSMLKQKPKSKNRFKKIVEGICNYFIMIITGKDVKGYKEYFNFISYYYFYEISSESMPIELYTMLQKNLGVYNHYEKVNSEMEMQYSMLNERRLSHIEIFIAILGIAVAVIGVTVALK